MPRSFRPVPASLTGSGPLLVVEDTTDLPVCPMVVYSYVDVPADWRGRSLERHLAQMQDAAVADLALQGWEYDGGPFIYTNPFTEARRHIAGGFALQRTGVVTRATEPGEVGRIEYAENRPVATGTVRYILAARYRKRLWKSQIMIAEEERDRHGGSIR
jgi:hypothetical protein